MASMKMPIKSHSLRKIWTEHEKENSQFLHHPINLRVSIRFSANVTMLNAVNGSNFYIFHIIMQPS